MRIKTETLITAIFVAFVLICALGALRIITKVYQPGQGRQAPIPASHDTHDEVARPITTTQAAYEWERNHP